jgi:hypothetical protein
MTNNHSLALAMIDIICTHDDAADFTLRQLLIDIDYTDFDPDFDSEYRSILRDCLIALDTHTLSLMRLDHSLCPMHHCDYAICFDDDDTDCANIRSLFPNHDT